MPTRAELKAKWKQAVESHQYDLANEYFLAAINAGAEEMDKISPGSGDLWRDIGKSAYNLVNAYQERE